MDFTRVLFPALNKQETLGCLGFGAILSSFSHYTITMLEKTGRNLFESAAQLTQLSIYSRNEDSKLAEL